MRQPINVNPAIILFAGVLVIGATGCRSDAPSPEGQNYSSLVIAAKPLAYWPLGEGSEKTVQALGTSSASGSYQHVKFGVSEIVPGETAPLFSDSLVTLPENSVFRTLEADFAVEAWVHVTGFVSNDVGCGNYTYGNGVILAFGNAGEFEFGVSAPAGLFYLTLQGATLYSTLYSPGVIPGWSHVVVERVGKTYQFYVNGKLNVSGKIASDPVRIHGPRRQLARGNDGERNSPFIGSFRDLALYPRALSPEEVSQHARHYFDRYERLSWYRRWFRSL